MKEGQFLELFAQVLNVISFAIQIIQILVETYDGLPQPLILHPAMRSWSISCQASTTPHQALYRANLWPSRVPDNGSGIQRWAKFE